MNNERDKGWPHVGDVVAYTWIDEWERRGTPERWTVFRRTPTVVELHRGKRPDTKTIRGSRQIARHLEPWTEEHEIAAKRDHAKFQVLRDCECIKTIASEIATNRHAPNETLFAVSEAVREALAAVKKAASGETT
jgi:hypothetical protein